MSEVYHFSEDALRALLFAHEEAEFRNHHKLNSVHVLLGLIRYAHVYGDGILEGTGLLLVSARAAANHALPPAERSIHLGNRRPTPDVDRLIARAVAAGEYGLVGVHHLWHAILTDRESPALRVLHESGVVDLERLRKNSRISVPLREVIDELEKRQSK